MKSFFLKSKNIEKDSYSWNMIASLALALQSAIILIVMSRTNSLSDTGEFSIAYAVSSLMLYVGQWGVRRYQASDVEEEHSFGHYLGFRIETCILMLIASLVYTAHGLWFSGYSTRKAVVVLVVCLIQLVDAYADVFYGRYQQLGRLDVSAKTTAFRVILGMAACMVSLVSTRNLMVSVLVWLAVVVGTLFTSTLLVADEFCTIKADYNMKHCKKICRDCLPLFLGNFLLLYVGNAPKYAIDAYMDGVAQARFNFIFMPVFVIGLLSNFVFNPVLVSMAENWNDGNYPVFKKMVVKQIGVIVAITVICITGAFFVGCATLSILYNTDLGPQKFELCLLLVGGGGLALVNFFAIVLTVMRQQQKLTWGYASVAILAKLSSNYFVNNYGIMGASVMYTVLMTVLALIFAVIVVINIFTETSGHI